MAEQLSPISAAKPPVANPISPVAGEHAATLKLKPVIRKPTPGGAPAAPAAKVPVKPIAPAAAPSAGIPPVKPAISPSPAPSAPAMAPKPAAEPTRAAIDQLKSVTQRLKGVTQEIPQQAILRKTGIISEQALTEAQKQASKARTARIFLADAIGAAPVKENAPMKTIRIKRPVDIGTSPATKPAAPAAPAPAPAAAPAASEPETTVTQRKTLKIARPGTPGAAKPTAKFGVKKPGASTIAKPAGDNAEAPSADVADIPDIPDMPAVAPLAPVAAGEKDVPAFVGILSIAVQIAACAAMGFLGWLLYNDTLISPF
ncbi:MAG: hypothetical protein IJQ34_10010 [Kiritimatiellae bacterium]|nr:hypothetical protein [Kiritimatiellia bacterium]